jgi:hypothetical protein
MDPNATANRLVHQHFDFIWEWAMNSQHDFFFVVFVLRG